jgi:outer membrane protein TolC
MAKTSPETNRDVLEAALHGLELQREKLEEQIAQVRSMLGRRVGRPPKPGAGATEHRAGSSRPRRQLSDEARKRIAAAQKKRWAAFRKSTGKKA